MSTLDTSESQNNFVILFLLEAEASTGSSPGCQVTMASGPNMMDPICLVESNAQFSVNQKALQILENISQPVVVVAIVGLYRTGKSYLVNKSCRTERGECCTTSRASNLNPGISAAIFLPDHVQGEPNSSQ